MGSPNKDKWSDLGMGLAGQIGGGIVGAGMGLLLEGHNDRRQLEQERKLQEQQMGFNKQMAEFNYQQQMKMWEATNYKAQMEQLKKAGLNPGLIYGMSGGGGATTAAAPATAPSGGTAPRGGGEAMGMALQGAQSAMQVELLRAQKENIEADTKNKLGDAANKPLVGANISANTELAKIEARIKNIDVEIKGRTIEDAIDIITGEASIATYEAIRTGRQNGIEQATVDATLQRIQEESIGAALTNILTNAKIEVETATVKKIAADIAQGWRGIEIKDWETVMKANNVPIGQVIGKLFNNALEEIRNATKPKYKGYTIPKGGK